MSRVMPFLRSFVVATVTPVRRAVFQDAMYGESAKRFRQSEGKFTSKSDEAKKRVNSRGI